MDEGIYKPDSPEVRAFLRETFEAKRPILIYLLNAKAVCGRILWLHHATGLLAVHSKRVLIPPTALNVDPVPDDVYIFHPRAIFAIGTM